LRPLLQPARVKPVAIITSTAAKLALMGRQWRDIPEGESDMRYSEIAESLSAAEKMAKDQEKKRKANAQLDDARHQRMDANRKQRETIRKANEKERQAKLKLSKPLWSAPFGFTSPARQ
jgi:hypothetical protein